MSLITKIDTDIKASMLARDQITLRGLRAVKAALLLARTEKGSTIELEEESEMKLLQKLIKQRKESAVIYQTQGRKDLAAIEEEEVEVIGRYLPSQKTKAEIEAELKILIRDQGITSSKDIGRLMGAATKHFGGQASSKLIAEVARKLLNS